MGGFQFLEVRFHLGSLFLGAGASRASGLLLFLQRRQLSAQLLKRGLRFLPLRHLAFQLVTLSGQSLLALFQACYLLAQGLNARLARF